MFAGVDERLLAELEPELEEVALGAGETLVRQGEVGDALYVLASGRLEVVVSGPDDGEVTLDRLEAGASVGEMALLTGQRRSATVRATSEAVLMRLGRAGFERLAAQRPELRERTMALMLPRLRRVQLGAVLSEWFAALHPEAVSALEREVTWVSLRAGETLFVQGEPANGAMYLLVSGRLALTQEDEDGSRHQLSEIGRGESVGEYAVLSDAPRQATAVALRDSQLLRLERQQIEAYPSALVRVARVVVERSQRTAHGSTADGDSTRTLALVPARKGPSAAKFAEALVRCLGRWGRVRLLSSETVDAALGRSGAAQSPADGAFDQSLSHWLNERESEHRYLVYLADPEGSEWTRRCLRQADKVVLVADARDDPAPAGPEAALPEWSRLPWQLALVHPDDTAQPSGTAAWLECRDVQAFHHLRLGVADDLRRVARRLTGRAFGLALSGGGARGYVHIGLVRAIEEQGVPVDYIAGTSMGALIGAAYALRRNYRSCYEAAAAFGDPRRLIDRTLPLVALTESKNVTRVFRELFGDVRIEDLWTPFMCVSSNLSRARPVIHERGPLWQAVRASTAIPGIFTPMAVDGDVLVDGGVMNNFPVDLLRERIGTGQLIGSSAYSRHGKREPYSFGTSVSGWKVLLSKINPFARRERYPNIFSTLMRATSLSSHYRMEAMHQVTDLMIRYPTDDFSALEFGRYEELIELGYNESSAALAGWLERSRGGFGEETAA